MLKINSAADVAATLVVKVDAGDGVQVDLPTNLSPTTADRLTVLERDTGWRNITSLVSVPLTSGAVYLRRIGPTVWLDFATVVTQSLPGTSWHTWSGLIPAGFRVRRNWNYVSVPTVGSTTVTGPARLATDGTVIIYGAGTYVDGGGATRMKSVDGLISWTTDNAWPTTPVGSTA